jgi:phospholipid/cholesterol/gamma-HCH transport system substrate-binding protein
METRANYVLIGAFTLLAAAATLAFALWAARYTTTVAWTDYEVRFSQAVTGLATGSTVQYNGINVGTVRELFLAPEDPRQVVARIRIRADAPVKEDTVARLTLAGLTGTTFITLTGGSPDSPPRRAAPGEELPLIPAEESALARLIEASEGITDTANEVLLRVIQILSDENAARVAQSIANIEAFTGALAEDRAEVGHALRNVATAGERLETMLTSADQAFSELTHTLERINADVIPRLPALGDDAATTMRQLAALTARADSMLAANEGALAQFGSEGLGQLGPTLHELRLLLQELSRVTRRIDRDPAQFLLGGSQPEEYRPQ